MRIAIFDVIGDYAGMHYYDQAYVDLLNKRKNTEAWVFSNFDNPSFASKYFPSFFSKNKISGILCFIWSYIKFAWFLCHNNYDRIIYMTYGEVYEIPFLIISSLSHKSYVDVHEVHALKIKDGSALAKVFESIYGNIVHRVIYHSNRTQNFLKDKKIQMIYSPHLKYAFNKDYKTNNLGDDVRTCFLDKRKRRYLFFGSLSIAKGVDVVIKTFCELSNLGFRWELVIAGKNVDDVDFSQLPKDSCKVIARHINDDEMAYLYKNTDYVLLPYKSTSQSGVFEMAAYFHKPMLLSDTEYFKTMIGHFPSFGEISDLKMYPALIKRSLSQNLNLYFVSLDCERFELKRDFNVFVNQICMEESVLEEYKDLKGKGSEYGKSITIDTEKELDNIISLLQNEPLLFRGVNEAKYKMYSSSQRVYLTNGKIVHSLEALGYDDFVDRLLQRVRSSQNIKTYLNNNKIPVNDMELLALLQHYLNVSPLLDFTTQITQALYFATDKMSKKNDRDIDNYISIYYINKNDPWIKASVQQINASGAQRANEGIKQFSLSHPDYEISTKEVEDEIQNLNISKLRDIDFIPLEGDDAGTVSVEITSTNFHTEYRITNPRLCKQSGMFILNNTPDTPLVELMNRNVIDKKFCCININKDLQGHILEKYLKPINMNRNTVYYSSTDDKKLENIFTQLFN